MEASKRFYETIAPHAGLQDRAPTPPSACSFSGASRHLLGPVRRHADREPAHGVPGRTNQAVDDFHEAALAAGYTDNGTPGERQYHHGYYSAYVLDPDRNNIEVVNHNR